MKNLNKEIEKITNKIEELEIKHDAELNLAKRMTMTIQIVRLRSEIETLKEKLEKRNKIVAKFAKVIGC